MALRNAIFLGLMVAAAPGYSQHNSIQVDEAPHFHTSPLPEIPEELSTAFFVENRERLRDTMPDSSMVVLFSAPIRQRSNDIDYPFHQDPDFFYYTGIRAQNALCIIFKNPVRIDEKWYREILFIEDKDEKKEMWHGVMLDAKKATDISGIGAIKINTEFKYMNLPWGDIKEVYANKNIFIDRDDTSHPGDLASLVKHCKNKTQAAGKTLKVDEAEDLFAYLRQKKTDEEIRMIQAAVDLTCAAHKNVMKQIEPGMTEYQLEAIIDYTFRYGGGEGPAFPSIVAASDNGGIMHYTANDGLLIPGDMVVIDIGAQYQGYAADITRTIPVSGTFSEEQKQVYQLVLDAQTVAIRYATKGYKFWTPHEEAYRTIGKGLIKLGIIKEWAEISKYFVHGTSHYLGLDVHDAGVYSSLQPGEVITVEPGVYIPHGSSCDEKWWGIYVRIEDDILITEGPAKVLSSGAPKTIEEIEQFMNRERASTD